MPARHAKVGGIDDPIWRETPEQESGLTFHRAWPDLLMWLVVLVGALLFVWAIKDAFQLNDASLHADAPENQNDFIVRNNSAASVKVAMCDSPQCSTGGSFLTDPIRPGKVIGLSAPRASVAPQWLVLSNPSDSRVGCLRLNNHHNHSKPRQILVTSVRPCPV